MSNLKELNKKAHQCVENAKAILEERMNNQAALKREWEEFLRILDDLPVRPLKKDLFNN